MPRDFFEKAQYGDYDESEGLLPEPHPFHDFMQRHFHQNGLAPEPHPVKDYFATHFHKPSNGLLPSSHPVSTFVHNHLPHNGLAPATPFHQALHDAGFKMAQQVKSSATSLFHHAGAGITVGLDNLNKKFHVWFDNEKEKLHAAPLEKEKSPLEQGKEPAAKGSSISGAVDHAQNVKLPTAHYQLPDNGAQFGNKNNQLPNAAPKSGLSEPATELPNVQAKSLPAADPNHNELQAPHPVVLTDHTGSKLSAPLKPHAFLKTVNHMVSPGAQFKAANDDLAGKKEDEESLMPYGGVVDPYAIANAAIERRRRVSYESMIEGLLQAFESGSLSRKEMQEGIREIGQALHEATQVYPNTGASIYPNRDHYMTLMLPQDVLYAKTHRGEDQDDHADLIHANPLLTDVPLGTESEMPDDMDTRYQQDPLDKQLLNNGWKETHGIALYSHPDHPDVIADTNAGFGMLHIGKDNDVHRFFTPKEVDQLPQKIKQLKASGYGTNSESLKQVKRVLSIFESRKGQF